MHIGVVLTRIGKIACVGYLSASVIFSVPGHASFASRFQTPCAERLNPHTGRDSSDRLIYREGRAEDLAEFHSLISSPDVLQNYFGSWGGQNQWIEEDSRRILNETLAGLRTIEAPLGSGNFREGMSFIAERKRDHKIVGFGTITRRLDESKTWKITYLIGEAYRHQGYAFEMENRMIQIAREVEPLALIRAMVLESNTASFNLLKKVGFIETERSVWPPMRTNLIYLTLPPPKTELSSSPPAPQMSAP